MRHAARSLAALLRSRRLQPASPDLAERIIRKAKRMRQRTQSKPRQKLIASVSIMELEFAHRNKNKPK